MSMAQADYVAAAAPAAGAAAASTERQLLAARSVFQQLWDFSKSGLCHATAVCMTVLLCTAL
jgi:hypothetical protein